MKIRNSFVSNSSSSSFIVIGIRDDKNETEEFENEEFENEEGFEIIWNEDGCLFGSVLADEENYLPNGEMNLKAVQFEFEKVKKFLEKKAIDAEVKLFYGTRNC